ncbi:hypothetical protein HDU76_004377 [Blyttiomyces sp. JEL0837]|nr:hypothetical protein HDU76_004377 [Blyttiomyces sp. JEL0837]
MPSLSAAKALTSTISLNNRRALVVGGTSGIGRATALKLASMNASVSIASRRADEGQKVLAELKRLNPSGDHEFLQLDLSLMRNARKFALDFAKTHPSLHYLVISAGIMSMAGRTETVEGIDRKLAVHYYGRFRLINDLMPLLVKTEQSPPKEEVASNSAGKTIPPINEVKCMTILAANQGAPIDYDDLDLKRTFTVPKAAVTAPAYNDLMVQKLAQKYPQIGFSHIFPGFVDTDLINSLPSVLSFGVKLFRFMMGGWLLTDKAEPIEGDSKNYRTEKARETVWEHAEKLTLEAMEKDISKS